MVCVSDFYCVHSAWSSGLNRIGMLEKLGNYYISVFTRQLYWSPLNSEHEMDEVEDTAIREMFNGVMQEVTSF